MSARPNQELAAGVKGGKMPHEAYDDKHGRHCCPAEAHRGAGNAGGATPPHKQPFGAKASAGGSQ
jgi:hypothetical protein